MKIAASKDAAIFLQLNLYTLPDSKVSSVICPCNSSLKFQNEKDSYINSSTVHF